MTSITVPPPPAGPGVQPPFVAPPTDGTRRRRWIGVSVAAGAVVLLCLGGAGAFAAVLGLGAKAVMDEARQSVTLYLNDLRDGQFGHAWSRLCPAQQQRISSAEFIQDEAAKPRIQRFELGQVSIGNDVLVPASLTRAGSSAAQHVTYVMAQNPQTGQLEVCGETG
jgi:hypothetical protein